MGPLVCPAFHFFLVHHGGDGLFFQGRIFFLQLIRPELCRFGHLPGAGKLALGVLGAGFGLALHLPCFLFAGFGRVGALFQLGVLLFQTIDIRKSGFVAAFCFFPLFRVLVGLGFGAFH